MLSVFAYARVKIGRPPPQPTQRNLPNWVSSIPFRTQSVRLSSRDIPPVPPVDIISFSWGYPW